MNDNSVVPVEIGSAIKPKHIYLTDFGPALIGTLGLYELEQFAAQFVRYSQQSGCWVGFSFHEQVEPRSPYGRMVDEGLMSETETSDGRWLYHLTSLAISQIYLVQSEAAIALLQAQLQRSREKSLFSRIKRHLKGVFVPMSPSI